MRAADRRQRGPDAGGARSALSLRGELLFVALLGLLAVRPLIGETFVRVDISFVEILPQTGATPATTTWLDTLTLAASTLALARGGGGRAAARAAISVGLLALAALVSTVAASDRFLALRAASNLVILVLGGLALLRLTSNRTRYALVVAAVLATGVTTALMCLIQEFYDFPQTARFWEEVQKPELIARGTDPNSTLFVNYERRLFSQEPYGFLAHPNVTATVLVIAGLVAAGVAVAACRGSARRVPQVLLASAVAAGCAWATTLTGSLGGLIAGAGGIVLLAAIGGLAPRLAQYPVRTAALLAGAYAGLVLVGLAYGALRGTLPGASLAFRWWYWTTALRAYEDVPLTGLGRENFGPAYQQYRPPESSEDVRNPHNLWVSLLVELGPLGLLAGGWLCLGFIVTAVGRLEPRAEELPCGGAPQGHNLARAAPLAAVTLGLQAAFSGTPFGTSGMAVIWLIEVALPWYAALALGLLLANGAAGVAGERWLRVGGLAAAAAALVHSLLDFGLVTPGGLAVFMLAAVAAIGPVQISSAADSPRRRVLPIVLGAAAVALHGLYVTRPVQQIDSASAHLQALLQSPAARPADVAAAAERLEAVGAPDAAALRAAARALVQVAQAPGYTPAERQRRLLETQALVNRAVAHNRRDAGNYILRARVHQELARLARVLNDAESSVRETRAAADAWQDALARNPNDPRLLIAAAEQCYAWYQIAPARPIANAGRGYLERALDVDQRRAPADTARLRADELRRVRELHAALGAATANPVTPPG